MDMTLRSEIVDFVRLCLLNEADQVGGIGQVAIMQEQTRLGFARVGIEVVNARGVEG